MNENQTTLPTAHSASSWYVGESDGENVVRIVLRSKDELRAWAVWCFDHCGAPDEAELGTA
jgi:hypothetical protein